MHIPRDQRPYNVRYYAAHRQAELDRVKRRQDATTAFLRDLRRVPCDDCGGVFSPYVMDFDHRDPRKKLFSIVAGHALLMSREKLIAEIEKCDAEPPNIFSRFPNGVSTASNATEPTTSRDISYFRFLILDWKSVLCA